jgi:hypothetical protein
MGIGAERGGIRVIVFGALHTMSVSREGKGSSQFDWLRVEVCPLGLHMAIANGLKFLHGSTFCEFWHREFVWWGKVYPR